MFNCKITFRLHLNLKTEPTRRTGAGQDQNLTSPEVTSLTVDEGVVDDLQQQPNLLPQDGEHVPGPGQQRQPCATEPLHGRPSRTGSNHRIHFPANSSDSPHVFWYFWSKTNRLRVCVSGRSSPLRCRLIFRQSRAISVSLVRCARASPPCLRCCCLVVVKRNDPTIATAAFKRNRNSVTSWPTVIGQSVSVTEAHPLRRKPRPRVRDVWHVETPCNVWKSCRELQKKPNRHPPFLFLLLFFVFVYL